MNIKLICLLMLVLGTFPLLSQPSFGEYLGGEEVLNAETKQVNQFFRRFNCEESPAGKRYYPGDALYRDPRTREQYLEALFDKSNTSISPRKKAAFISDVVYGSPPQFLNFHGGDWLAEVSAKFRYRGREEVIQLFLQLQEEPVGSKWVITRAYGDVFAREFAALNAGKDDPENQKFLHPMSHELDFINLGKIFQSTQQLEMYASQDFRPDHLTLFLFEMKRGNMKYVSVMDVKFHFFQIKNWYFELTDVQRPGKNRGWLITGLAEIPEHKKDLLLKFIYHEN
ncbi:MAG: hypothetical protein D6730_21365 [Bacteroidetes bacterium]|nr:MAG: hypothetical protein D6730_21365 [Bacteroidota bacterium]